jgi:hypothetical protein
LNGVDYVVAKLVAIAGLVFAFSVIPQIVLFVGQMLVRDKPMDYLGDHADVLWKAPLSVAIVAIYFAAIVLAISSMTSRRIVAGAVFIGLVLTTATVSGIIVGEDLLVYNDGSMAGLINLFFLPLHLRDLVFLGHVDPTEALGGVTNGGLYAVVCYLAVLARGVGVVRAQGGAHRAVVLVRAGRHRVAGPERRGEDHVHAHHHRAVAGERGHGAGGGGRPAPLARGAEIDGARVRGRGGAGRGDGAPVGAVRRRPAQRRVTGRSGRGAGHG